MFDIDQSVMRGIAKFPIFLHVYVLGIDYAVLPLPPLKKLQVFVVLGVGMEVYWVLLNLLRSEVVAE